MRLLSFQSDLSISKSTLETLERILVHSATVLKKPVQVWKGPLVKSPSQPANPSAVPEASLNSQNSQRTITNPLVIPSHFIFVHLLSF
jgi:hypothetical protein